MMVSFVKAFKFLFAIMICFGLAAAPCVSSAADAETKKKSAKSAKSAKNAEKKSSTKKKAEAQPGTANAAQAEQSFADFQKGWMQKISQHGSYGSANAKVTEDPNQAGSFVAMYTELGEIKNSEVKKTDNKATPFVGTIKYERTDYVCRGKTRDEAVKGPFKPEPPELVTEIFRYTRGKWVY